MKLLVVCGSVVSAAMWAMILIQLLASGKQYEGYIVVAITLATAGAVAAAAYLLRGEGE